MGNNFLNFPKVNLFEKQLEYFLECVEFTSLPDKNTIEESIYLSKITDKIKTYKKMKWKLIIGITIENQEKKKRSNRKWLHCLL